MFLNIIFGISHLHFCTSVKYNNMYYSKKLSSLKAFKTAILSAAHLYYMIKHKHGKQELYPYRAYSFDAEF